MGNANDENKCNRGLELGGSSPQSGFGYDLSEAYRYLWAGDKILRVNGGNA